MSLSVLIPFRSDRGHRDRLFRWVRERYRALLPEAQICQGDALGEFSRGQSINEAFALSRGSVLLIADADTIFFPSSIRQAVDNVENRHTWVIPYTSYYTLTPQATEKLLEARPVTDIPEHGFGFDLKLDNAVSGLNVLPREAFETVCGFDTRFRGWGFEDRAFQSSLDGLWAPFERLPGCCCHLWHPEVAAARFAQPFIRDNEKLADRYRRAVGHPNQMRALVAER